MPWQLLEKLRAGRGVPDTPGLGGLRREPHKAGLQAAGRARPGARRQETAAPPSPGRRASVGLDLSAGAGTPSPRPPGSTALKVPSLLPEPDPEPAPLMPAKPPKCWFNTTLPRSPSSSSQNTWQRPAQGAVSIRGSTRTPVGAPGGQASTRPTGARKRGSASRPPWCVLCAPSGADRAGCRVSRFVSQLPSLLPRNRGLPARLTPLVTPVHSSQMSIFHFLLYFRFHACFW